MPSVATYRSSRTVERKRARRTNMVAGYRGSGVIPARLSTQPTKAVEANERMDCLTRGAQPGTGADALQPTLRYGFRARLTADVGRHPGVALSIAQSLVRLSVRE